MNTCFLHRFLLSWSRDSGRAWPSATHAHLGSCSSCKTWWNDQRGLEAHLATPLTTPGPSPGFTASVLRKIEFSSPELAPPSFPWPRLAILTGAACLFVLALFISPSPTNNSAPSTPLVVNELLPKLDPAKLQELPGQLESPLEKEFQLVISDTRKAMSFVAGSILPRDYLAIQKP